MIFIPINYLWCIVGIANAINVVKVSHVDAEIDLQKAIEAEKVGYSSLSSCLPEHCDSMALGPRWCNAGFPTVSNPSMYLVRQITLELDDDLYAEGVPIASYQYGIGFSYLNAFVNAWFLETAFLQCPGRSDVRSVVYLTNNMEPGPDLIFANFGPRANPLLDIWRSTQGIANVLAVEPSINRTLSFFVTLGRRFDDGTIAYTNVDGCGINIRDWLADSKGTILNLTIPLSSIPPRSCDIDAVRSQHQTLQDIKDAFGLMPRDTSTSAIEGFVSSLGELSWNLDYLCLTQKFQKLFPEVPVIQTSVSDLCQQNVYQISPQCLQNYNISAIADISPCLQLNPQYLNDTCCSQCAHFPTCCTAEPRTSTILAQRFDASAATSQCVGGTKWNSMGFLAVDTDGSDPCAYVLDPQHNGTPFIYYTECRDQYLDMTTGRR